jgi:hypothetical protein
MSSEIEKIDQREIHKQACVRSAVFEGLEYGLYGLLCGIAAAGVSQAFVPAFRMLNVSAKTALVSSCTNAFIYAMKSVHYSFAITYQPHVLVRNSVGTRCIACGRTLTSLVPRTGNKSWGIHVCLSRGRKIGGVPKREGS